MGVCVGVVCASLSMHARSHVHAGSLVSACLCDSVLLCHLCVTGLVVLVRVSGCLGMSLLLCGTVPLCACRSVCLHWLRTSLCDYVSLLMCVYDLWLWD